MYKIYKKRREILLWMKQSRKCPKLKVATSSSGLSGGRPSVSKQSKYEEQVDKMAKLEEICGKLRDKHSESYTPEQLRTWAIMIQLGTYVSYDTAPDKLFFKTGEKGASGVRVSPGKCLNMRSECIDQLDKWYRLVEKGAITSAQYTEIKDDIMADIACIRQDATPTTTSR